MLGDPSSLAQARVHFEQALRLDGSYVPALLGAAEVAFDGGDSAAALHYSEAVLRSDPRNLPARVYRARSLFSTSRFREARSEVELVLKLYPTSVDARYELARLDAHEERYDAAETSLGMLASGGDPRAPGALAELSLRMGRFRRAAVQYRALIARDSKNAALLVRLGECEAQLDHAEPAASAFLKAQAIAPADPRPRVDLAILYDRLGRNDDARRAYQAVLQVQPDNPVALNNLAALDAETGVNLDQALSNAHRAQDQRPKDPDIQDTVGLIYIQKNLKNEGLEILRRLVDQNPANATYRRHLALALYLKGDRPGARQNLESALRSKPGDREQGKIKALLAKVG